MSYPTVSNLTNYPVILPIKMGVALDLDQGY